MNPPQKKRSSKKPKQIEASEKAVASEPSEQSVPYAEREIQRGGYWANTTQGLWVLDEAERMAFRAALIEWFRQQQRDLPWRRTTDPYAIWLSEIMLQQTRVETVIPYYHRFLAQFPTVFALAQASLEEVLGMWSGLGYYRRAKMLHHAAKVIVDEHAGCFPATHREILSLPGIGRYTAGAIASIAFGEQAPLVDGNVFRILSRLFSLVDPLGSKELESASWQIATLLVRGEHPGDLNQALMELGATCCLPRKPSCLLCPVRPWCRRFAAGDAPAFPTPKESKETPIWQVAWAFLQKEQEVLLIQRPNKGLFAEMWEFPGLYQPGEDPIIEAEFLQSLKDLGLFVSTPQTQHTFHHLLTHRKLSITVHVFAHIDWQPTEHATRFRWVDPHHLPSLPLSSIVRRVFKELAPKPTPKP